MREIDLSAIRERLAATNGRTFWRSLEEVAGTPEFRELLHREFPVHASEWDAADTTGRRQFLKLMGASLALAGAGACTRMPREAIVPYVRAPEEIVPGRALFFATAMPHAGGATPVLVESHMGRPTKIEPNPQHPATRGGTDVYAQASVLTLYDPDRSQAIKNVGQISSWTEASDAIRGAVTSQLGLEGAGLRILSEAIVSPTLAQLRESVLAALPEAKWYQYEPLGRDHARRGAQLAFGRDVDARYRFDKADVILSLDSDFLSSGPGHLRYVGDFVDRRRLVDGRTDMNRLYVVESTPTNTGSRADHRVRLKASSIESVARAVAAAVGVAGVSGPGEISGVPATWIAAVAEDLQQHRGTSLVLAGDQQPDAVHALCHAINDALGNGGATVEYTAPVEPAPAQHLASLTELASEMDGGRVDVLFVLSSNPVYTAPADLQFAERMNRVPLRFHLGLFEDETAAYCHWHIPESHYLESWGDARMFDGTVSIVQPLIAPLYESKSMIEVVAAMVPTPDARTGHEIVRDFWRAAFDGRASGAWGPLTDTDGTAFGDFDRFWRKILHEGYIPGTALPTVSVSRSAAAIPQTTPGPLEGLEVTFSADPTVYDGRFANNGWLQELPKPLSKITWDNVAYVSPATAEKLGVSSSDLVTLNFQERSVTAPIWIMPGQPDDSVNLQLGYGRQRAGRVGDRIGYNAYQLRSTSAPWFAHGLQLLARGEKYEISSTQTHFMMEDRDPIKVATLEEYRQHPDFAHAGEHAPGPDMTLYGQPWKYTGTAWGMTIDLNACTGCNACVVACVAENNIPVVGKDQVGIGRAMHWLTVDRYYMGELDNPSVYSQPRLCMQCENAPCEVVCPVAATSHNEEGLNDMVYNRCVGTRYCMNNCPYKVRRFNFLLYADWNTESLKMQRNPDVTVRSRGVMEKCTYCVQRINHARIQAKLEDRQIRDGEIETACEAACATRAIVFGDINDPNSRVAKLKREPRDYGLLMELGTRPRTTYLAAVRNPNPRLEAPAAARTTEH